MKNGERLLYLAAILICLLLLVREGCNKQTQYAPLIIPERVVDTPPDTVLIPGEGKTYYRTIEVEIPITDTATLDSIKHIYGIVLAQWIKRTADLNDSLAAKRESLQNIRFAFDNLKLQFGRHGLMDVIHTDEYTFAYQVEAETPITAFQYDIDIKHPPTTQSEAVQDAKYRLGLHARAILDKDNTRPLFSLSLSNGPLEVSAGYLPSFGGQDQSFMAGIGYEFSFGKKK